MADNLNNQQFKDLAQTLRQLGASAQSLKLFEEQLRQAGTDAEKVDQVLQSMADRATVLQTRFDSVGTSVNDIGKMLAEQVADLSSAATVLNRQKSMYSSIANINRDIAMDASGIIDLNKRDLSNRLQKLESMEAEFKFQAQLANQKVTALQAERRQLIATGQMTANKAQNIGNQIKNLKEVANFNEKESRELQATITNTQTRLKLESDISKTVGVTGAIVEGTGALMERLGMRSGIFHDAMKDAAQEMRDQAKLLNTQVKYNRELVVENNEQIKILEDKVAKGEELTDQEEKRLKSLKDQNKELKTSVTFYDRTKVALEGAGILAKGFGAALRDPAVAVGAVLKGFLDVNKAAVQAQRYTGEYNSGLQGSTSRLASTKDILETTVELTKELGMSANLVFSKEMLANAAELKNRMGLTGKEAAGLAVQAQASGKSIDAVVDSTVNQVNAFNKANRSAVNHKQIIEDVGNASDSVRASTAQFPGGIAKAAAAARRLGLSLQDVDNIASSLLDFESSIESELEAQLLTGKNINMAKARELALNNDLAGLGNEIFKNSSDINEFGKMNRIQQEAQAKALGLTRDQLARIAYQKARENGLSAEAAAKAANVNAENMKAMDVQEKIAKLVERIQQAFAPILDVVVDIVDAIAPAVAFIGNIVGGIVNLLNKLGVLKPIVGSVFAIMAASAVTKNIAGIGEKIGGVVKNATAAKKSLMSFFNDPIGSIKKLRDDVLGFGETLKDTFTQGLDKGKGIKDKVSEVTQDAKGRFRDAKGRFAKDPDKAKELLSKAKGKTKVEEIVSKTKGADKVSEVSDKAADSAKKGSMVPQKAGQGIKDFLTNLAAGLKEMASGKVIGGAFALIPAALGLTSLLPALPSLIGLQFLNGKAIKLALKGIGEGLKAFGSVVAKALPQVGLALLALAGIGAAMIPLTYALSKLSPLISAIGDIIRSAFEGIGSMLKSAGEGIALMLEQISLEKVAALALLGPALISASSGLGIFSIAALLAIPGINALARISSLGPGLDLAGNGITIMAEGVAKLASALNSLETSKLEEVKDLITTTALAAPAVAATGAITSLIQGISGDKESNTDPAMVEKLDAILAAIQAGGNVYIDGNKAGQAQVLGTYRQ